MPRELFEKDKELRYKERVIEFWQSRDKKEYRFRSVVWRHIDLKWLIPSMVTITILIVIIYTPSLPTFIFAIITIIGLTLILIMKAYSPKKRPLEKELD